MTPSYKICIIGIYCLISALFNWANVCAQPTTTTSNVQQHQVGYKHGDGVMIARTTAVQATRLPSVVLIPLGDHQQQQHLSSIGDGIGESMGPAFQSVQHYKYTGEEVSAWLQENFSITKVLDAVADSSDFDGIIKNLDEVSLGDFYRAAFPNGIANWMKFTGLPALGINVVSGAVSEGGATRNELLGEDNEDYGEWEQDDDTQRNARTIKFFAPDYHGSDRRSDHKHGVLKGGCFPKLREWIRRVFLFSDFD